VIAHRHGLVVEPWRLRGFHSSWAVVPVVDFAAAGLGVAYGTVRLERTAEAWIEVGAVLAEQLQDALIGRAVAVAHVGSTSVMGLLAKPIIDLAIGVSPQTTVDELAKTLSKLGWIYRGDAGAEGGWVFVLEDAPWRRVAHAHGVAFAGTQWTNYHRFRDLLRRSASARLAYEDTKQQLALAHPDGRALYTAGKTETVSGLLKGTD
jgi:GrpB-like predicted nucleotidyltransferase (UPF0157 family)